MKQIWIATIIAARALRLFSQTQECIAPPPAPTDLVLSVLSPYQIHVHVTPADSLGESFQAFRSTDEGATFMKVAQGYPQGFFTDSFKLLPSTEFCYKVRAMNGCGVSSFTPLAMSVTEAGPLPNQESTEPAFDLTATANLQNETIELSWTLSPFIGVLGQGQRIVVYKSTDGGVTWHQISSSINRIGYVDASIQHGVVHYYKVRTHNNFGWGNYSFYSNIAEAVIP